jgi:cytochrome c553
LIWIKDKIGRVRYCGTMRIIIIAASPLALALTACQTAVQPEPNPPAFVEAACGGCHAVAPPYLSPNPRAPAFAAIARRNARNEAELANWLANAHNYPEMMDFDLSEERAEEIAGYIASLR